MTTQSKGNNALSAPGRVRESPSGRLLRCHGDSAPSCDVVPQLAPVVFLSPLGNQLGRTSGQVSSGSRLSEGDPALSLSTLLIGTRAVLTDVHGFPHTLRVNYREVL
jgi:hypothetical protein